jgi:hypothetical protein
MIVIEKVSIEKVSIEKGYSFNGESIMSRKFIGTILSILPLLLATPFAAQGGKYAGEFLSEGVGARALAMGGAYVAVADDATANYWNPAGLCFLSGPEMSVSHVSMFDALANFDALTVSSPLGGGFGMGVSYVRLSIDNISRYGELQGTSAERTSQVHPEWRSNGQADGSFNDTEQAYIFSFGKRFDFDMILGGGLTPVIIPLEFSIGASGKYISQSLDDKTGTGQGFDLGSLIRISLASQEEGPSSRFLTLGFQAQNLGSKLTWDTDGSYQDEVSRIMRFGLGFTQQITALSSAITLATELDDQYGQELHYGGEYAFRDMVFLRGGADVGDFTAGAGLKLYMFQLDYAFVGYELGNTHRLSAAVSF